MYGATYSLSPTTLMLIERLRRAIAAANDTDDREATDDELIAYGIAAALRGMGVSPHVNAAMLHGLEAEPDGHIRQTKV